MCKWCSLRVALVFVGMLATSTATAKPEFRPGKGQAATAGQQTGQPASPDAQDVLAVITQSRSTNTRGYTVTIHNDGSVVAEIEGATIAGHAEPPRSQQFPAGTVDTKTLRNLLTEIGDVSKIPTGGCAKSVSFGTRTAITYAAKTSRDLQCVRQEPTEGNHARQQASQDLANLVQTTLGQLKINASRMRFVRPPEPSPTQ